MFDRAGRFVTYVKVSDSSKLAMISGEGDSKRKSQAPTTQRETESSESETQLAASLASSSFMVSPPDGNVYLVRGATRPRLYAISAAGEVIRDFEVPAPAPDLTTSNVAMAGDDKLFISFTRVQGGFSPPSADSDGPRSLISVIRPQTYIAVCPPASLPKRYIATNELLTKS